MLAVAALLAGCSSGPSSGSGGAPQAEPSPPSSSQPAPAVEPESPAPPATDGSPRPARLSIPALDLSGLRVQPYPGTPDDGPGTAIQDAGALASPYGTGGLVGPGGIGNYLVTGHRTSSTQPFAELPALRVGARVVVEAAGQRLVYEIVGTRSTSFRSPASLRAQSAAVPGHPRRTAAQAMITLSTCATAEDHAAGNYWSDEFHNPEHRIEKIGVLRRVGPA